MSRHSIADAKNNFSALVQRARRGEAVEITLRGQVVARLEPVLPLAFKVDMSDLERRGFPLETAESARDIVRAMRDEGW
jgi:prevent-host-death family protein